MRSLPPDYTAAVKEAAFPQWSRESVALPAVLEVFGLQGVEQWLGVWVGVRTGLRRPIASLLSLAVCNGVVHASH